MFSDPKPRHEYSRFFGIYVEIFQMWTSRQQNEVLNIVQAKKYPEVPTFWRLFCRPKMAEISNLLSHFNAMCLRACWRLLIMMWHVRSDNIIWIEVHHGILFDRRLSTCEVNIDRSARCGWFPNMFRFSSFCFWDYRVGLYSLCFKGEFQRCFDWEGFYLYFTDLSRTTCAASVAL